MQLSSRTLARASTFSPPQTSIRSSQWRIRTPAAALSLSGLRHASTTPTTPAPGPASAPQAPVTEPASTATSTPNLDSITLDDIDLTESIRNIPEGIGYLKSIGIDYGIGPTSMIQWTLEHIHIWGGLPWWGAIAATAVLLRVVTFPLYLKSADMAARNSALISVTQPLSSKLQAAQKAGDQAAVMQAWQELNATRKAAGLSYTAQLTPMVVQAVLGFCSFRLMRAMATLPVPGLQTGGFGWLTDLTVTDGYLILPAIMAGAMHMMFRYGGESGQNNDLMNPTMKQFMLWGMPLTIFIVTGWQPGALCIWFVASGTWAMGQAMLIQKPAVRELLGLTPMYKPVAPMTIDTTAKAKSTSAPGGGNTSGTYQAPRLRRTDARGASSAAPTPGPAQNEPKSSKGLMGSITDKFSEIKKTSLDQIAARNKKQDKAAIARAAEDYEKRAQRKKELQGRGR